MGMLFTDRLVDAFAAARRLHATHVRKGTGTPYLTHLMAVAALVAEYGGDEDQVVAALLHDAVEDQGGRKTLESIRDEFGETVAFYVESCSESDTQPKPPWRERKEAFLSRLAEAGPEVRLICAADKLHNARSMSRDLRTAGNALWQRFNGGRDGTLWYMQEALNTLAEGWSHPILAELAHALASLRKAASGPEATAAGDS